MPWTSGPESSTMLCLEEVHQVAPLGLQTTAVLVEFIRMWCWGHCLLSTTALFGVCEGDHAPIVTYDKNNMKIVFHIGKDRPRPDVVVVAVSVTSSNTSSVKAFTFKAAVPKVRLT